MGAWGAGLYSNDIALDLRGTVAAVCRLPLDGAEIVAFLEGLHPGAADPDDEDHTTFWLVLADQLHRRGIASPARDRALEVIANGSDLAVLAELEMSAADLRKRERVLAELAERLNAPLPDKRRRTLTRPQPLLLAPGEVFTFPVDSGGNCVNPYITRPDRLNFRPAGWGSCLVLDAGHALDYLAWYQIAPDLHPGVRRPTLAEAMASIDPAVNTTGTLTRNHRARMQLDLLGTVTPPEVEPPTTERLIRTVTVDVSIANILSRWKPDSVG